MWDGSVMCPSQSSSPINFAKGSADEGGSSFLFIIVFISELLNGVEHGGTLSKFCLR